MKICLKQYIFQMLFPTTLNVLKVDKKLFLWSFIIFQLTIQSEYFALIVPIYTVNTFFTFIIIYT